MVSCSADQVKAPGVAGVSESAACTEFVSIGLLNVKTRRAAVETLVDACAGLWLMTTGSSGCISDCAMKIFAVVLGTEITGVTLLPEVEVTTMVSLVLSRLTSTVPLVYEIARLVRVWVELAVLNTTKTSSLLSTRP